MSQKAEKPTLQGQRIKTRKRDEKEKYDPFAFRDAIVQGLTEAGTDLEQVSKFLDSAGSKLNYRRYAEPLLDVLFAGGVLVMMILVLTVYGAPGGSLVADVANPGKVTCTDICIFRANDDFKSIRAQYEVLYKLIRRYKYIEKTFEEELKKLILFLKGFEEDHRRKLATVIGICLANGLGNPSCLSTLFEDHLVKDGLALEFAVALFRAYLQEKDMSQVASMLKRAGLEAKLLNLFPINKRTQENFENYFGAAGLDPIVEYQRVKATAEVKKQLQKRLDRMIKEEESVKEVLLIVKEQMQKYNIPEHEAVVMAWNSVMGAVDWPKKEELVADQALKHWRNHTGLLSALTESGRSELTLLLKVQEYCYDNMNFMKAFQKIIILFYKGDVLSEDVILKWYREAHSAKGKSVFLEQMKSFVEWLENAEEESDEEEG